MKHINCKPWMLYHSWPANDPRMWVSTFRRLAVWQCSSCRRVFTGEYQNRCPNCGHTGYWTGSVVPDALRVALDEKFGPMEEFDHGAETPARDLLIKEHDKARAEAAQLRGEQASRETSEQSADAKSGQDEAPSESRSDSPDPALTCLACIHFQAHDTSTHLGCCDVDGEPTCSYDAACSAFDQRKDATNSPDPCQFCGDSATVERVARYLERRTGCLSGRSLANDVRREFSGE